MDIREWVHSPQVQVRFDTKSDENNVEHVRKLFACFGRDGGTQFASWIAYDKSYRFTLEEARDCSYGYGATSWTVLSFAFDKRRTYVGWVHQPSYSFYISIHGSFSRNTEIKAAFPI